MEFEENDGKTERKNFAIYFSNILSQKFLLLRSIKSVFKERLITIILFCNFQLIVCQPILWQPCLVFAITVNNDTLKLKDLKYRDNFRVISHLGQDTFAVHISQSPICVEKNHIFILITELPKIEIEIIRNSIDTMKIIFFDSDIRFRDPCFINISFQKGIYKLNVAGIAKKHLDAAAKVCKELHITDQEEINKIYNAVMKRIDFSEYEFMKSAKPAIADYAYNVTPHCWKQYLTK